MAKKRVSVFADKVSQEAHEQKTRGAQYGYLNLPKGVSIFKPPTSGKVFLDILPYEVTDPKHPDRNDEKERAQVGNLWYKRPYKVHRNIGPNNDSYVCPTSIGMPCPICEYRAKRKLEGADDEELKALNASKRNLYCVIPLKNKDFEAKPHIWDMSHFLFQDYLVDELEENPGYGIFPSLEEGLTLRIRFAEKILGKNKFGEVGRIDFEERDEAYSEDILDEIPNLDEVLTIYSYKQLEAKFLELDGDAVEAGEDDEVQEEEEPTWKNESRSLRRDKKFSKAIEAEEEEEEEEEEEQPRRRKGRPAPEPEEEEEEPEEEEEEEEPAKATRTIRHKPEKVPATKPGKNKCPYGHVFGKDCDEFPKDCDICDLWDGCMDKKGG